jgi:hypothetical protein
VAIVIHLIDSWFQDITQVCHCLLCIQLQDNKRNCIENQKRKQNTKIDAHRGSDKKSNTCQNTDVGCYKKR